MYTILFVCKFSIICKSQTSFKSLNICLNPLLVLYLNVLKYTHIYTIESERIQKPNISKTSIIFDRFDTTLISFFFNKIFFSQNKKMIPSEDAKDAFSGLKVMPACNA